MQIQSRRGTRERAGLGQDKGGCCEAAGGSGAPREASVATKLGSHWGPH